MKRKQHTPQEIIVRDLYPGFEFENIKVLIDTPEQAFGEYEFTGVSSKTDDPFTVWPRQIFRAQVKGLPPGCRSNQWY